jgi:hypothetical protein
VPGTRYRAHVHELPDAVRLQHSDEFSDGPRGMADGPDG